MASKKTSKKRKARRTPRRVPVGGCPFCEAKKEPDYKDYQTLRKFLTDRAKVIPAKRSGVCSKHQRRLLKAIKRARHLGLLPFSPKL